MDAAALPADWTSLVALVFLLGLKHGFDADHLATIDGLTRVNSRADRPFARYCGALFSIGHGAIVMLIALLVGSATSRWETPAWLETSGVWISILFLTALGLINIRAVLAAAPDEVVQPVGLKGRFLGKLAHAGSPGLVALVGALFALSFDTVSQAALFALTATQFGGLGHALMLGLVFTVGMLVTDGINGLWISRLILRSDEIARVASRVIGLAVGTVSLLIAAFSGGKMLFPRLAAWSEGKELAFGAAVILVVFGSFVLGRALARSNAVPSPQGDRAG